MIQKKKKEKSLNPQVRKMYFSSYIVLKNIRQKSISFVKRQYNQFITE